MNGYTDIQFTPSLVGGECRKIQLLCKGETGAIAQRQPESLSRRPEGSRRESSFKVKLNGLKPQNLYRTGNRCLGHPGIGQFAHYLSKIHRADYCPWKLLFNNVGALFLVQEGENGGGVEDTAIHLLSGAPQ